MVRISDQLFLRAEYARIIESCQRRRDDGLLLDNQRRLSRQYVTHPYQRWLGATPSSRYAILIRLR